MHRTPIATRAAFAALIVLMVAACGGSDITIGATPTVTATPTNTAAPTATRTSTPATRAEVGDTATATHAAASTPTAPPISTATAVSTATPVSSATAVSTATAASTVTPTAPPTATSGSAAVAGLIVVGHDVRGATGDGLTRLPPESLPPVGMGFDRGLGNAAWVVDDGVATGNTTDDGHFSIVGLTPGPHVLHVTKTVDGNLLDVLLPIVVGDDGSAEVLAEVSWGLVRTTSTYTEAGAESRAVYAPNGSHVITRGGQIAELGDSFRTLVDADGDGHFDPQSGACEGLYRCDPSGGCASPEAICVCISSCPFCDDCPSQACVSRASLMRPDCGPDGLCKALPYGCGDTQSCSLPGDQCSCIASCPDCTDCVASACRPPCTPPQPVDIVSISVFGPSRLVIGQDGGCSANATLSDGTGIDVTWLATWASSHPSVAAVDSWGRITALAAGSTDITAALGDVVSDALAFEVVERPTLQHILIQNASCFYPLAMPEGDVKPLPPSDVGPLPPPSCQQVLRIGATIQFIAVGEFDTGYYEDISDEVTWSLDPADVGSVVNGLFTGSAAGTTHLTASLGAVVSDQVELKVVTEPTIIDLSIYPADWGNKAVDGGPGRGGPDTVPCFECGYSLTVLRGDTVRFGATAHYDTGEWEDVSARVVWHSSDATVASIDANGVLTAENAGEVSVDASLAAVTSTPLTLRVVNEATLQSLYAYQDGQTRAIGKGDQAIFHASAYYDLGFARDVTAQATWHSSDETVGGFDSPGVFTGRAAGTVSVWAELDGRQSDPLSIEVFATSELSYCDPDHVNRGTWSDDFNRVTLESDCDTYTLPDVVELRFSVTESQMHGGIFDPCLDLFAYAGDTLVRTIRQEGCGDPFLPVGAPGREDAELKYQLKAFWDLKDGNGAAVPAGKYTIRGRFYLYYDPVVQIEVNVLDANSTP
jgi:hypothetical protein